MNGPKAPGAINGGFYQKDNSKPHLAPHLVISVDDLDEAIKTVKAEGGVVLGGSQGEKPDDIPGVGLYVSFKDTEGNVVGMLQPSQVPMKS